MPDLGELKNKMLTKAVEESDHLGALEVTATNVVTWTASAGGILTSSGAHGLTTGQLVVPTAIGGSQVGLVAERPYYVKEVSSTQIELSMTSSFVKEEWTGSISSATFVKLAEISETRAAGTLSAAAKGAAKDVTVRTIAALGACTYEYIGWWHGSTAGVLLSIGKCTKEILASASSIEIKENELNLNGGA